MLNHKPIRRAAVLGAGQMGSLLAAHLANADVEVLLYGMASDSETDPKAKVRHAIAKLEHIQPPPLTSAIRIHSIQAATYQHDLKALANCDLIVETIRERDDSKQGLYARLAPYFSEHAIIASHTAGLSINGLAQALPEAARRRFCGMHFLRPPRYRPLVELVPCTATDPRVLDRLETFLVMTLGKRVIRANDTPFFIANRLGFFSLMVAIHHADRLDLSPDLVDALTRTAFGLPETAIFGFVDRMGLDTVAWLLDSCKKSLPDDPWFAALHLPAWLQHLVDSASLDDKTNPSIYKLDQDQHLVFNPATQTYGPIQPKLADSVRPLLHDQSQSPEQMFATLQADTDVQAQFQRALLRDVLHYAVVCLDTIAPSARELDAAMRWGFAWSRGPLETWQALGWRRVARWLQAEITSGKTLVATPLPAWVGRINRVYSNKGAYSSASSTFLPRSKLAVYQRQLPALVYATDKRLLENDVVTLSLADDGIAVAHLKHFTPSAEPVLASLSQVLDLAEANAQALVLWPQPLTQQAGDVGSMTALLQADANAQLEQRLRDIQQLNSRLRTTLLPIVAAVQGRMAGSACELLMHCDRIVAAMETQFSLVEPQLGLTPLGGSLTLLAQRIMRLMPGLDSLSQLRRWAEEIACITLYRSADEARQCGLLAQADPILFNPLELLYVAKGQAQTLIDSVYRPPLNGQIAVVGRQGFNTLQDQFATALAQNEMSELDYQRAVAVARVLCGGDCDTGAVLDHESLWQLEREAFMRLHNHDPLHKEDLL